MCSCTTSLPAERTGAVVCQQGATDTGHPRVGLGNDEAILMMMKGLP